MSEHERTSTAAHGAAHSPGPGAAHGGEPGKAPGLPEIDLREYGGRKDGERQVSDRRLFMQLFVFDAPHDRDAAAVSRDLAEALADAHVSAIVYDDANDPHGIGLLTWSEEPAHFVVRVRPVLSREKLRGLRLRPEFTMLGRTYSSGHEPRLHWWLLEKPVENVTHPEHAWHVWYPLRRTGAFARLDPHTQGQILKEHAQIGMAYGQADLAHDVRLACHGLDAADNEFVIGLVGRELYPLSHVVMAMRKTVQTSEYIEKMGPFFVGYVAHRVLAGAG
jgi:chlorite dismutase